MAVDTTYRRRIRDGDPRVFSHLFDAHAQEIYRYGLRLSGDRGIAEELVSLTFLEAWRLRGRVDAHGESLRPWLYGIARNVLRNLRRTARRHRAALARLPAPETTPDILEGVLELEEERDQVRRARAALGTLSEIDRQVIALCIWQELSYEETAAALQIPVGTVKSRLSRARRRLERSTLELGPLPATGPSPGPPPSTSLPMEIQP